MKPLLILIFTIFSISIFAQIDTTKQKPPTKYRTDLPKKSESNESNILINMQDIMPIFPACDSLMDYNERKPCADKAMLEFIYENIHYPDSAKIKGIEGTVVISFIVKKDGTIENPKIIRAIGGGCEEESMRVVRMFPKFIPGELMGKRIDVQFNLPIRFRLE